MKVSKLMMKLAEKRDESLLIAQKCQEAIDELSEDHKETVIQHCSTSMELCCHTEEGFPGTPDAR